MLLLEVLHNYKHKTRGRVEQLIPSTKLLHVKLYHQHVFASSPVIHVSCGGDISIFMNIQSLATTPEDNSFFPSEKEELPQAGFEPATFSY